jgi:hypothetical protein
MAWLEEMVERPIAPREIHDGKTLIPVIKYYIFKPTNLEVAQTEKGLYVNFCGRYLQMNEVKIK